MLEKFKNFDSTFKLIKDNLTLIILIPTVIGGIWQTLELLFIDLSFVRFFSPTQLVSDGLVILSIIGVFSILYFFLSKEMFKSFFKIDISDGNFSVGKLIFSIIAIGLSVGYFIYTIKSTKLFENNLSVNSIFFAALLAIICVPLVIYGIREILIQMIKWDLQKSKTVFEAFKNQMASKVGRYYDAVMILTKIFSFLTLITFLFLFFAIIKFRDLLIYPQKFENVRFVFQKVHKDFGNNVKPSLLYFNDKYLFVELESKINSEKNKETEIEIKENQIVVYKTEDILFPK